MKCDAWGTQAGQDRQSFNPRGASEADIPLMEMLQFYMQSLDAAARCGRDRLVPDWMAIRQKVGECILDGGIRGQAGYFAPNWRPYRWCRF